jgi:type III secretion protein J
MRVGSRLASASRGLRGALCVALIAVVLAGCRTDLYTKLSEAEANEIVAVLVKSGISASRGVAKDGTSTVKVDEDRFADAVLVLNRAGLPREKFVTMGEVFADTKLVSSPTEERARFIYALSQELSKTISEIDGVFAARVHIVLPKNDPFREDEKPSSASVFIKHDPAAAVSQLLPQIKTLVTNSVEGLSYDKVTVVFVPAEKNKGFPIAELASRDEAAGASGDWLGTLTSPAFLSLLAFLLFLTFGIVMIWRRYKGRMT